MQDSVKLPDDARAVVIAPNIVAARFIQLTPAYNRRPGDEGRRQYRVGPHRPCRWSGTTSKLALTQLSQQLDRRAGRVQGPLGVFIDQAADTFDGNGDSFRRALRELSQTAGRLGDPEPTCSAR